MNAYLLTWNPSKWPWDNLAECVAQIKADGSYSDTWSSGRNKSIVAGDRVFLIRQGLEPRGIVASGWVTSSVFEDTHWDKDKQAEGYLALYVWVNFDVLLDADRGDSIFPRVRLNEGILRSVHWDTQVSGISIDDEAASKLEIEWARFLAGKRIVQVHEIDNSPILPEEIPDDTKYFEGVKKKVLVNSYERDPLARKKCIEHYGLSCYICGFNFEKEYGDIGVGFIHVHHLKPLAEINERYEIDPIRDLRPVCPNCHAMIHRRQPPYTIDEVRKIWEDELNK